LAIQTEALIFDVDGTLYRQAALRRRMLVRLLSTHVWRPRRGLTTMRVLSAYRKAQETLRETLLGTSAAIDLASAQIAMAAKNAGADRDRVAAVVGTWMERAPLSLLPGCRRPGLVELLDEARRAGVRLAVLSDYPAQAKLEALGIAPAFEAVVSSSDPHVQRFKPDPRGLKVLAARMGVDCRRAIYIGDRPEIDAAAARQAGMSSFIIGGNQSFPALPQLIEQTAPARAMHPSSRQAEDIPA
jgi:FMN phosphatase YigB (HAD superfamily)